MFIGVTLKNILYLSYGTNVNINDAPYIHFFSLAKHLKDKVNMMVMASGDKNSKKNIEGVKTIILKRKGRSGIKKKLSFFTKNFNLFLQLNKIKGKKFDIVYERLDIRFFAGALYAKINNIPLVYEVNDVMDENLFLNSKIKLLKPLMSKLFEWELKQANALIVPSEELKMILQNKYNLNNINVVHNGTEMYNKCKKVKSNKIRLVFIGALDGVHPLENIFNTISTLDNLELTVFGEGPNLEHYEKKYKSIIFKGRRPHSEVIDFLLTKAEIGLHDMRSGIAKKYGNHYCQFKLLEYMATGTPAFLIGEQNSLTRYLNGACKVFSNDHEFAEGLKNISRKELMKMGDTGRKLIKIMSWEDSAKRTADIINKI